MMNNGPNMMTIQFTSNHQKKFYNSEEDNQTWKSPICFYLEKYTQDQFNNDFDENFILS